MVVLEPLAIRGLNGAVIKLSVAPPVQSGRAHSQGELSMATKKAGMSDAQADAIAAAVIVVTVVVAAVYWVATAG